MQHSWVAFRTENYFSELSLTEACGRKNQIHSQNQGKKVSLWWMQHFDLPGSSSLWVWFSGSGSGSMDQGPTRTMFLLGTKHWYNQESNFLAICGSFFSAIDLGLFLNFDAQHCWPQTAFEESAPRAPPWLLVQRKWPDPPPPPWGTGLWPFSSEVKWPGTRTSWRQCTSSIEEAWGNGQEHCDQTLGRRPVNIRNSPKSQWFQGNCFIVADILYSINERICDQATHVGSRYLLSRCIVAQLLQYCLKIIACPSVRRKETRYRNAGKTSVDTNMWLCDLNF